MTDEQIEALAIKRPDIAQALFHGIVPIGALTEFARAVEAAEREECAQIAETPVAGEQDDITMEAKDRVAAAIRARSNA